MVVYCHSLWGVLNQPSCSLPDHSCFVRCLFLGRATCRGLDVLSSATNCYVAAFDDFFPLTNEESPVARRVWIRREDIANAVTGTFQLMNILSVNIISFTIILEFQHKFTKLTANNICLASLYFSPPRYDLHRGF